MGTFKVGIRIGDPQGETFEDVEALVDTGATYSQAAASMLRRLGVVPHRRARFELPDGRVAEYDVGRTVVELDGRRESTLVVFVEEDAIPRSEL